MYNLLLWPTQQMQDWARLVIQVQDSIVEPVILVLGYAVTVAQVAIAWSSFDAFLENLLNVQPDVVDQWAVTVVTACGQWFWRAMLDVE